MTYNTKIQIEKIIIYFGLLLLINSCGIYSFSGTSLPKGTKTIFVNYIANNASLVQPSLSTVLTERLKTKFLNETNLLWVEHNADINFSGNITEYKIEPISIQGDETASQNRLTISVEISYLNTLDTSNNFTKVFRHYEDFKSTQNLNEIEEDLNLIIIENIIDDIFNESLINW